VRVDMSKEPPIDIGMVDKKLAQIFERNEPEVLLDWGLID